MLKSFGPALACGLAGLSLALSGLHFYRVRSPLGLALYPFKLLAGSLAAFLVGGGVLGALLGLWLRLPLAVAAGATGAALSGFCVYRVTAPHGPARPPRSAGPRRAPRKLSAQPRWERDVPFWTLAGRDRPLLCDIWRPPEGVSPTGLAIVYLHNSAWHLADKDLWTRPLLGHLAAQGHVVMDVAYRLCPEVDLYGMLGDVRRAIAWLKANAGRYGVRPERVVVAGASAGGHLALLAAYTPGHPDLTPAELQGVDTTVRGVVSCYGLADMLAFYRHMAGILPSRKVFKWLEAGPLLNSLQWLADQVPGHPLASQVGKLGGMSLPEMMASLLGGQPCERPAVYELASPITHAGAHCPPTLLIQGEHDIAAPPAAARALQRKLAASGVPATLVLLPYTDHMFDLLWPRVSPAVRAAWRELDRFLARLA